MSLFNYLWVGAYFAVIIGVMCHNAYHHNFQLLALWVLVTTQGLALGGALHQLKNEKTRTND